MAESDDIEVPDNRDSSTGKELLTCYKCGSDFYFGGGADRTRCSSCSKNVLVWRARLTAYGSNQFIAQLAEEPKTSRDLDAEPTEKIRDVVQKLRPPGNDGKGKAFTVYYLPGDERRAVDVFIDVNHSYVASCLTEERNNQLAQGWPDGLYQLLVEQWHWNSHALNEVDE